MAMQGTAARHSDPAQDAAAAAALAASEKDRAENLMIVDLLRNDLGQVCQVLPCSLQYALHYQQHDTAVNSHILKPGPC